MEPTDQASSGSSQSRRHPARPAKGVESGVVGHGIDANDRPAAGVDPAAGSGLDAEKLKEVISAGLAECSEDEIAAALASGQRRADAFILELKRRKSLQN